MEKNWIKIWVGTNPIEVELTKQMLEEHDIPAVVLNKQDSSYRFGSVELYVHESHEAAARLLLVLADAADDSEPHTE